jgi:hypothetical protein
MTRADPILTRSPTGTPPHPWRERRRPSVPWRVVPDRGAFEANRVGVFVGAEPLTRLAVVNVTRATSSQQLLLLDYLGRLRVHPAGRVGAASRPIGGVEAAAGPWW